MNRKLFLFTYLFCVLATGYGQDQWKWLNPQPSGFYNVKIVFADRLTGFILNTNNDLLKTTDRGGTWTIAGNFRGATCLDIHDSTGVMSGNGGVLYLSTDNGNTWNSLQSGISDQVQFVNVVSRDSFFLSTAAGTIYATGDRGSTWSTRNSHTNISCITFLNSMTGFIGSNTSAILRTKDGGVSWHTVDSVNYFPANILSIQFLNVDTGYAFREYDSLLWTYDGGNTWSGANVNAYQSMYAVNFVNRSLGFLAGEDGALYRSADGGATWSPVMPANSFLYGYDLSSIAFTSPDTGFVVGALGRILRTTDSGQTWNSYSPAYSPIYSAVFGSPSTGYAANGSYILKTTDSGQTWNRLGLTTGLSYGSYSVFRHAHFTSADTGYVVSDQYVTVHKTNDGGQTWQSINPEPYSYSDLLGESYLNPQTGILSLGTALAETQDGGNSWSQFWTAQYQGQSFSNIFFLDNNIAFATNGSGALYKTTNAFQSWTQVFTNPLGYTITGVWFLNANKGFITDDETQIFVTNDGGNSWQPVSFSESFVWDTFNSVVRFFSPQVGYITNGNTFGPGSVGRIYKTVDGGQTWQLSYKAGGATIEFTPDSNVLVSGYGGAILRSPIKGWQVDSLFVL
ncbi:MAG TPA: YCF48-related protein, partial [Puia sp.]|nr:YCF48-related protein [Puia sp.]